ncbi:DMT family transporter [Malaciobacter mytili]|uniref:DMT family transporter n=1 Tax=Malaciobacter mytili TaxID=603050 RepID=UPI003A8B3135
MNNSTLTQIPNVNKAMLFMVIGVMLLPFTDTIAKYLSTTLSPTQIAWLRFTLQALFIFILTFFIKEKIGKFKLNYLYLGFFVSTSILLLFWGLKYLPLANNIALFFIEPLVLTLLSIVFLKEKVFKEHIIAVILGLIGTLIIIRPNLSMYGIAAFLPILSAILYALYLMFIRLSSNLGNSVTIQFYIGIVASLFLSICLLIGESFSLEILKFNSIDMSYWWIILALGILTTFIQLLISKAFYYANASVLASFQYLEIIFATFLGWIIFNDIPDRLTILGAFIVIFAGLYLIKYERKKKK